MDLLNDYRRSDREVVRRFVDRAINVSNGLLGIDRQGPCNNIGGLTHDLARPPVTTVTTTLPMPQPSWWERGLLGWACFRLVAYRIELKRVWLRTSDCKMVRRFPTSGNIRISLLAVFLIPEFHHFVADYCKGLIKMLSVP